MHVVTCKESVIDGTDCVSDRVLVSTPPPSDLAAGQRGSEPWTAAEHDGIEGNGGEDMSNMSGT